ncbi:DUF724 domain-containing protein 6 isoform X2 [Jatropha curcas]|uniref:DUF724 domain-containing protein 6 isoform X2 n=1 Tax=Jatropha curcas TaxID=180498 RepID=UPI0005FBAD8B|nr:DUF724 domain-containing protein 6 isoform X2 [Jatropha curcas]
MEIRKGGVNSPRSRSTAGKANDKDNGKKTDFLREGNQVEVSSDDEGFKGAWYVATIIKSPASSRTSNSKRKAKALVQYHNLVSDINENEPLTEYVAPSFIRPLPLPMNPNFDQSFEPYDVVDASHRDGWWKGVVLNVLEGNTDSKKYTVFFENPPEQFEFASKDLRFHCDWIKGEWVRPPKQERMDCLKFGKGMAVEVSLDKENDAWFPATVIEEVGFNSFLVEYSSSRNGDEDGRMKRLVDCFHIRAPPPNIEVKNFEILETVDVFYDSSWRHGLITKILTNGRYNVFIKYADMEKQFSQSEIRPHLNLVNGTWVSHSRVICWPWFQDTSTSVQIDEQSRYADNNGKNPEVAIQIESSSAAKDSSELKSPCKSLKKNRLEQSTPTDAKSVSKKAKKRTPKSDEALSCPSKKLRKEKSANHSLAQAFLAKLVQTETTNQEGQVTNSTLTKCTSQYLDASNPSAGSESRIMGNNMGPNQQEAGLVNEMTGSICNKEGQLNSEEDKIQGESAEFIVEVGHVEKYADSSAALAEWRKVSHANYQLPDQEINKQKESDGIGQQKGKKHNVVEDGASKMGFEDCATKEVELSAVIGMESGDGLVKISALVSSANNMAKEVSLVDVGASSNTTNDGQALSICFEGTGERQVENLSQCSAVNVPEGSELVNGQGIPFVKSSSIWKNIESLEVFKFLPQKPHFGPLIDCKVASREGCAIGNMLTFATVVERTSKLKVDDPRDLFDSYIETLTDLEMLGFDVKLVMDRLNRLLAIKDRQEQLQHQSKDVAIQIEECVHEKTKLREDIDKIDKIISELEEQRAMKVSLKVTQESEIIALQVGANGISEDILSAMHEFESLAASPW